MQELICPLRPKNVDELADWRTVSSSQQNVLLYLDFAENYSLHLSYYPNKMSDNIRLQAAVCLLQKHGQSRTVMYESITFDDMMLEEAVAWAKKMTDDYLDETASNTKAILDAMRGCKGFKGG